MMRWLPLAATLIGIALARALRRTAWAKASLRASRIAYGLLVLQMPAYFLAKSGFEVSAPACEWRFGLALAQHSLTNYPHIILFALFFLLTYAQLPGQRRAIAWSVAATLTMGFLLEIAEGIAREGHCRMRDLIPDSAGILIGITILILGKRLFRR